MASSGAARAAAKRLVVFGGTGFVGSAIAEEATRRGLAVTCVTRTGAPPPHVAAAAWSASVDWRPGNALEPDTYRDAMRHHDAVVTSVGRLPLPSLTHEEVVRDNGETNIIPGRVARELGVPRLVVVGASIPAFVPGMAFGFSPSRGVFRAGYAVGKDRAEAFARDEFVGAEGTEKGAEGFGAVVLKPGGVSGTRHVDGVALPLWIAMAPASACLLYTSPSPRDATLSRMPSSA